MRCFKRLCCVPLLACFLLFSSALPGVTASAATTLTLSASPNPAGNYVALNWTNSDKSQPYSYMLYSKSSHETAFQSIPSKASVKVLNIYPDVTPTVTFTTWQGQNYTLPKSASLKIWMETPNQYDPKGFGKGLISVDPVSITSFNASPNSYLKNSDGTYKYDTLYFGAWDAFASEDLSAAAETVTDAFIKTGRGVLFGHDTMVNNDTISMPNFFKLAHYCNIQTISHYTILGNTQIKVFKKGLLTNYPWQVGDIGTVLNVPMSHSNQMAFGDIWMTYQQPFTYPNSTLVTSGLGTNNFYLTSWSNAAMIQTGHSNGDATPDEQRVTANTLFYLSQITTDTSWSDHKGQDLDAPDAPAISGITHNSGRTQYTVSYSSQDNATGYQYYVESTGENDGMKYDSPTISTSIESGMKGYSIAVDNNPSGVPDGSITTTAGSYTFARPSGSGFYVHIAAADNVGNVSAVSTYHVDELVSVTHPVSVGYAINPNSAAPFTAPDVQIVNNSTIPIRVSVQSLSASTGGSLTLNDVSPSKYADWSKLTTVQTRSNIALGLGIRETAAGSGTWSEIDRTAPLYASDITDKTPLGVLNPNGAAGTLELTAKYGLAWDKAYTSVHSLSLFFDLTD
ncbi:DUF5057 domain-containing protein [Ruminococcaceae bacterium CPB6]|jgi:hypothetical protein|nr:DUF5057 domain-containing protein [Ruminococcaceae bacterium CPB6]